MTIRALFTLAKRWKRIHKMCSLHTMKCNSAWVLTPATTWMRLGTLFKMEIGRCKRTNILIPLLELPGTVKFQETESKTEATVEQGKRRLLWWVQRLSLGEWKVLEMDNGDAWQHNSVQIEFLTFLTAQNIHFSYVYFSTIKNFPCFPHPQSSYSDLTISPLNTKFQSYPAWKAQ